MTEIDDIDTGHITMRLAGDADWPALRALAQLDSIRPPEGPALVASVGGEIVAALWLDSGRVAANPFLPTAPEVALLRLRAEQLRGAAGPARRRSRLRRLRLRAA